MKTFNTNDNFNLLKILVIILLLTVSCKGSIFNQENNPCGPGEKKGSFRCEPIDPNFSTCIDPDLSLIYENVEFTSCDGTKVKGKKNLNQCSSDNQKNCITNEKFPSIDKYNLNPKHLITGKKIGGVEGTRKKSKSCRNQASLTFNDSGWPPSNFDNYSGQPFAPANVNIANNDITFSFSHGFINDKAIQFSTSGTLPAPLVVDQIYYVIVSSTTVLQVSSTAGGSAIDITSQGTGSHTLKEVGDGVIDTWETVWDNPTNTSPPMTLSNPWTNGDEFICDGSNFKNITSSVKVNPPNNTIPVFGNVAFTHVWEETYTGIQFTNILYNGSGSTTWEKAVKLCLSLNATGTPDAEKWYLPTQKEVILLYITGLRNLEFPTSSGNILSSTIVSNSLNIGLKVGFTRVNTLGKVLCVK